MRVREPPMQYGIGGIKPDRSGQRRGASVRVTRRFDETHAFEARDNARLHEPRHYEKRSGNAGYGRQMREKAAITAIVHIAGRMHVVVIAVMHAGHIGVHRSLHGRHAARRGRLHRLRGEQMRNHRRERRHEERKRS